METKVFPVSPVLGVGYMKSGIPNLPFKKKGGICYPVPGLLVDSMAVQDGDGFTVYVNVSNSDAPKEVVTAVVECNEARAARNYERANALQKEVKDAGYAVLNINNKQKLARKYRIRLRGIDAPETNMPYGEEAKEELVKILSGQCLKILVYNEDQYGRFVGDIYCNGIFVQKLMLKKGLAWHYTAYDNRPKLAKWEQYARAQRIGLWADPNPEMPWEWRKNHPEQRY